MRGAALFVIGGVGVVQGAIPEFPSFAGKKNIPLKAKSGLPKKDQAKVASTPRLYSDVRSSGAKDWTAWRQWSHDVIQNHEDNFGAVNTYTDGQWATSVDELEDSEHENLRVLFQKELKEDYQKLNPVQQMNIRDLAKCTAPFEASGGQHPNLMKDVTPVDVFNFGEPIDAGKVDWGWKENWSNSVNLEWSCPKTFSYLRYDGAHSFRVQVTGERDIILIHPRYYGSAAFLPYLHHGRGQTSMRLQPEAPADYVNQYPLFSDVEEYTHVRLKPGMALWIPPNWLYTSSVPTTTEDGAPNPFATSLEYKVNNAKYDAFVHLHAVMHAGLKNLRAKQSHLFDAEHFPFLARLITETLPFLLALTDPLHDGTFDYALSRMNAASKILSVSYGGISDQITDNTPTFKVECEALKSRADLAKDVAGSSLLIGNVANLMRSTEGREIWSNSAYGAEIKMLDMVEKSVGFAISLIGSLQPREESKIAADLHNIFTKFSSCPDPVYLELLKKLTKFDSKFAEKLDGNSYPFNPRTVPSSHKFRAEL